MAERYVVDTHALFWYLTSDAKLSAGAREAIERRRGETRCHTRQP